MPVCRICNKAIDAGELIAYGFERKTKQAVAAHVECALENAVEHGHVREATALLRLLDKALNPEPATLGRYTTTTTGSKARLN